MNEVRALCDVRVAYLGEYIYVVYILVLLMTWYLFIKMFVHREYYLVSYILRGIIYGVCCYIHVRSLIVGMILCTW